jgi:hypothetical protein
MKIKYASGKKVLVMSKSEWKNIGFSTKWLKISAPIQMEDKRWIDEINGEIVEVPPPSVNIGGINFVVGGTYETEDMMTGNKISYNILEIFPGIDMMRVKDNNGKISVLNMVNEAKDINELKQQNIITKQEIERQKSNAGWTEEEKEFIKTYRSRGSVGVEIGDQALNILDFNSANNAYALGYLAANGRITVQVPFHRVSDAKRDYQELTGLLLDTPENINNRNFQVVRYRNPVTGKLNKAGMEYRIYFKPPPVDIAIMNFGNAVRGVKQISGGNSINDNNFIRNLWRLGFSVGNNYQNVHKIRENIPENLRTSFDNGARN